METYDLVIVGAGPIGLTCAIEAVKNQLSYVVLEKGTLVNSIYHFPTNMHFFSTSSLLEIGEVPFISHSEKPTRREALEYFRRVREAWNLNIHYYEEVSQVNKKQGIFHLKTRKNVYKARNVILATGFYGQPKLMNVPGESLPKVHHYYTEAHPYVGQKVIVVGAANSACDVALELFYKGAEVTMVIRGDHINDRVKYWIRPNIENRIKEGSIKTYFRSEIIRIKEDSVQVMTPEGILDLPNDYVLAMTGYTPDFDFLESAGIERNPSDALLPSLDPETLESHIPGLFLAGVIVAGEYTSKLFIENARIHAGMIVSRILEREKVPVE